MEGGRRPSRSSKRVSNDDLTYLVIDLEATCDRKGAIPREQSEIIEIGAVLVDDASLAKVDEWQTFVRPLLHPTLTPFCIKLTSITQAQVDSAPTFPDAARSLADFIADRSALFCSWGDYDRAQFEHEAHRHSVSLPLGSRHMNIKEAFRLQTSDQKPRGVSQALSHVGLSFEGTAHRGIDDARNIARLLPYALGRLPLPGR